MPLDDLAAQLAALGVDARIRSDGVLTAYVPNGDGTATGVTMADDERHPRIIGVLSPAVWQMLDLIRRQSGARPEPVGAEPVTICRCEGCGAEIDCDGLYTISDGLCANCVNGERP